MSIITFESLKLRISAIWPLIIGFIFLVVPSYYAAFNGIWSKSDQAHGPLVLLVVIYLFWDRREFFLNKDKPKPLLGWLIFSLGLLSYVLGRSQDIIFLDLGAQILVLSSLILIFKGWKTLRLLWFPIFFIFFMIPLPGSIIGSITMPMKIAVSHVAEFFLYHLDYPIARTGVILQIGQYQLLVADACAGMYTLISLEALGLLYLTLVKHDSIMRNLVLALLIIPISFTANTIRVIVIALVTYYWGDEVGQGFIHGFAGIFLFMVALGLIISVDTFLQHFSKNRKQR